LLEAFAGLAARLGRSTKTLAARAAEIEGLSTEIAALSDSGLREAADGLRRPLRDRRRHRAVVARAFAVVRETATRRLGMRHYPVQLMGALALIDGRLVEMQTGEGKTLTASLASATAALSGMPTHIHTVNDYLAARDAEFLRPLYEALGLSVGLLRNGQGPAERRAAYAQDITYGSNKEFAFDYLRDRLAIGQRGLGNLLVERLSHEKRPPDLLLRGLHFAIVDEADSVLIDEARTPLIISDMSGNEDQRDVYTTALEFAGRLLLDTDYSIPSGGRAIEMTASGSAKIAEWARDLSGVWRARRGREHLVAQALNARYLYHRNQQYVVVEDKVQIVDAFTGRIAYGRSWQNGLHQLIEAKEGCTITGQNNALASITYQQFFNRYLRLAGMSGTLAEAAGELSATYGLDVVKIPTHRASIQKSIGLTLLRKSAQKWDAIVTSALEQSRKGRPVLIATRSVSDSERLSGYLSEAGCDHVVLNARHDLAESAIVAEAGVAGRITVATNMAGRGTDIKLGTGVAPRGGLHVILTEFNESARIDRQVIGRGGRQGDPGTYEVIVALDDELFLRFARRLSQALRGTSFADNPALSAHCARLLRRCAQVSAQRQERQMRRTTVRHQRELDRSLGFAGSP
jgi:preprotein translocase subunit SecA